MTSRRLERHDGRPLDIDLCFSCRVIWFDSAESTMLSAASVIELFRELHTRAGGLRVPLRHAPDCPRCTDRLVLTHDAVLTGPIMYLRCPLGDGRLTPFFQFLREKQFVRPLNPAEVARLRAAVKQVRCSGCGAPIRLEEGFGCGWCGAPVALLDDEAVAKTLANLSARAAARPRTAPAPRPEAMQQAFDAGDPSPDLLDAGLGAIGALLHHFGIVRAR